MVTEFRINFNLQTIREWLVEYIYMSPPHKATVESAVEHMPVKGSNQNAN